MPVRAKFVLTAITRRSWDRGAGATVRFDAQYDQSIPEDRRFSKATPSGHFEMQVDNPSALEQLELGKAYYLDITPAETLPGDGSRIT